MFTYYTRKESRVQIPLVGGAPLPGAPGLSPVTIHSFPSFLALLFVMFERRVETADHFRSGFEERLRLGVIYFANVVVQMFD
jgi:hypothetical protein